MHLYSKHKQQGLAIIVIFFILILSGLGIFLSTAKLPNHNHFEQSTSTEALQTAKQALINFASTHTLRPGSLPCPDFNNDGFADTIGINCQARLGWLPFRTLGIKDLRDTTGERLWYAVDQNHQQSSLYTPFNSDTPISLLIDGNINALAVILAPTTALNGQNGRVVNDYNTNGNANRDRRRYLEENNANNNFNIFSTTAAIALNDRLDWITPRELWPQIETRVINIAKNALLDYNTACGTVPNAAAFILNPSFTSQAGLNEGYFPFTSINGICTATFPAWFSGQNWPSLLYYANNPNQINVLNWNPSSNIDTILVMMGRTLTGTSRPSANLTDYMEANNQSIGDNTFEYQDVKSRYEVFNDIIEIVIP